MLLNIDLKTICSLIQYSIIYIYMVAMQKLVHIFDVCMPNQSCGFDDGPLSSTSLFRFFEVSPDVTVNTGSDASESVPCFP